MKTQLTKSLNFFKFLTFTLAVIFISNSCGSKELATYNGGKVTEKDYKEILKLYDLQDRDNPEFKKNIVRQIAIINTLADMANQKGIDKTESFQFFVDNLMRPNIAKNLVLQEKKKELEKDKNRLYRARHILIKVSPTRAVENKDGSVRQVELTAKEQAEQDLAARNKVEELRTKILSKEITFEQAATDHSEDGGSKVKGGDLGYFTKGIMVNEFQLGLDRLAGEFSGDAYRVKAKTSILESPGGPVKEEIEQGKIVHGEATGSGEVKLTMTNRSGYISTTSLEKLEKPGKVSQAIRSLYGWHIIELIDTQMADFDDFVKLVKKTEYKDVENGEAQAKQKVEMYWSRLQSKKQEEWQKSLYSQHNVPADLESVIDQKWQAKPNLLQSEDLTITSSDFLAFVTFLTKEQNMPLEDYLSNLKELQNLFQYYIELQIFIREAQKMGVDDSKEFQRREELERKSRLATLYVNKHWVGEINITDEQLKAEYGRYKDAMKQNKMPVESFSKMKDRIRMQIEQGHRQQKMQMAEGAHLKQIAFVLSEELNAPPPPPPSLPQGGPQGAPGQPPAPQPKGH